MKIEKMIAFASVKRSADGKSVVLSDFTLDRAGERLRPEGCDFSNFQKYSPMLIGHDYYNLPVGKWVNFRLEDGQILGDPVFSKTERAKEVVQLVEDDCAPAVSVGLIVKRRNEGDPTIIEEWELLEVSWVSVPANPNALMRMHQKGMSFTLNTPKDLEKKKQNKEALKAYRDLLEKINKLTNFDSNGEHISESEQMQKALEQITNTFNEFEELKKALKTQKLTTTAQVTPDKEKALEVFKKAFTGKLEEIMAKFYT